MGVPRRSQRLQIAKISQMLARDISWITHIPEGYVMIIFGTMRHASVLFFDGKKLLSFDSSGYHNRLLLKGIVEEDNCFVLRTGETTIDRFNYIQSASDCAIWAMVCASCCLGRPF
jgi:hypothetical protein